MAVSFFDDSSQIAFSHLALQAVKLANLNGKPEIFYSIQGEGPSMGKPAIFIRLSQCNLHCTWCDTDYTWNWKDTPFTHDKDLQPGYEKYDKGQWVVEAAPGEITDIIGQYPCKRVILTGGEPMMQQKELIPLAEKLRKLGYFIEIETNGTYLPKAPLDELIDQFNISPKLSNSNNELKLRIREQVLTYFSQSAKAFFKFVLASARDLQEVQDLQAAYNIAPDRIYLMPEGITPEELNEKQQWLVEICKAGGYNYTDRLHVHIYGDKRGV